LETVLAPLPQRRQAFVGIEVVDLQGMEDKLSRMADRVMFDSANFAGEI
jgi:hypothetical protein